MDLRDFWDKAVPRVNRSEVYGEVEERCTRENFFTRVNLHERPDGEVEEWLANVFFFFFFFLFLRQTYRVDCLFLVLN